MDFMGPFDSRSSAQNGRADWGGFRERTLVRNAGSACSSYYGSASSTHRGRGGQTPFSDRNTPPRVRIAEKLKSLTDILKNIEEKPSMKQQEWKLNKPSYWEADFPALRNSVFGQAIFAQQGHELPHRPLDLERKVESRSSALEHSKEDCCSGRSSPREKISPSRATISDSQSQGSSSVSMRCALKESMFDKLKADSRALSSIKFAAGIASNPEETKQQQHEELPSGFNWTCQNYFESQSNSKGPNPAALHSAPTMELFNNGADFTKQVLQRLESMEQMLFGKFADGQQFKKAPERHGITPTHGEGNECSMEEVHKYASSMHSHLARTGTAVQAIEKHMQGLNLQAEDTMENETLELKNQPSRSDRDPGQIPYFDSNISNRFAILDKTGVQEDEGNMRQSDSSRFKRIEDQCTANHLEIQRVTHSLEDMQKLFSGLSNEIELFWSAINQLCIDNEKFREELRSRTALFHHRLSKTCPNESGRMSRQETHACKANNSRRDIDETDSE